MLKQHKKILVPKLVSFNPYSKKGYVSGGTKVFVEKGVKLKQGLPHWEKWGELRKLARNSKYYIKRFSPRAREVGKILTNAGIRVEKEIQDLKNGTALFENAGYELGSWDGLLIFKTNPAGYIRKIEDIVAKMHSLGIIHNHLHAGNLAITRSGQITILDLGRARKLKLMGINSALLFMRLFKDRSITAKALAGLSRISRGKPRLAKGQAIANLANDEKVLERALRNNIDEEIVNKYSSELKKIIGLTAPD